MTYLLIILFVLVLFFIYMVYKAFHDRISNYSIRDQRIPESFDDYRIFFISDIHRRIIRQATLQKIKTNIDIIIIGGDLTEKGVPLERTHINIQRLKQFHVPIYFIWGNNDYEVDREALITLLKNEGVRILSNKSEVVSRKDESIVITGLENSPKEEIDFDSVIHTLNEDYHILLVHSPFNFYIDMSPSQQDKVQLCLSGHTHGGQIRIFGFGLYKRGGLSKYRQSNVFVSEGYGYTHLPLRLGTNAECHVLTLKAKY